MLFITVYSVRRMCEASSGYRPSVPLSRARVGNTTPSDARNVHARTREHFDDRVVNTRGTRRFFSNQHCLARGGQPREETSVQRLGETEVRNTRLDSIACKDLPGFQGRAKHRPQRNNGDITPFRHKSTRPGSHGRALTNLFTEVVGDILGIPDSKWPVGSN